MQPCTLRRRAAIPSQDYSMLSDTILHIASVYYLSLLRPPVVLTAAAWARVMRGAAVSVLTQRSCEFQHITYQNATRTFVFSLAVPLRSVVHRGRSSCA